MELILPTKLMDKFLMSVDMKHIIDEASVSNTTPSSHDPALPGGEVDDGPRYFYGNPATYKKDASEMAAKLGFQVVDYLIDDEEFMVHNTEYPDGPVGAVSYFPVGGIEAKSGTNIWKDERGRNAYELWVTRIRDVAEVIGFKIIDFLGADAAIQSTEDEPIALSDPKSEEPEETEEKTDEEQHSDPVVIEAAVRRFGIIDEISKLVG